MNEYEDRKQARIDRYREKAEKARQESNDLSRQASKMAEAIPVQKDDRRKHIGRVLDI